VFAFNAVVGNLGVGLDVPIFVDPEVAIGYDFEMLAGPAFASVLLPSIGDNIFELWLFDSELFDYYFSGLLSAGEQYFFGPEGADKFRVMGIETYEMLDPNDPTAFVTGLTFTGPGIVDFTQTAIRAEVPAPTTLVLLLTGLGVLAIRRRNARRQRVDHRHTPAPAA